MARRIAYGVCVIFTPGQVGLEPEPAQVVWKRWTLGPGANCNLQSECPSPSSLVQVRYSNENCRLEIVSLSNFEGLEGVPCFKLTEDLVDCLNRGTLIIA